MLFNAKYNNVCFFTYIVTAVYHNNSSLNNPYEFLYCLGDIPVIRLKYFPKNVCVGKFNLYAISCMLKSVCFNIVLASRITESSIHSIAVLPLYSLILPDR